ncbi:hypothetical protein TNCV_4382391 [Trichonephila clavipes]|nr:hypothetical protein TNCV_4382391 [Trichonephila clavipes]
MLGYTPERVNQLIGRKTKRALRIFLITLPRNLDNLKIFDLKTLSYLSIRVEGYDDFGHNSANTIDIALIKNFYYPFTINSIDDISSDHNPVFLNFNFKLAVEPPNPRAVSTDWNVLKTNLNKNLSLFDFHPNSINSTNDIGQKITEFTEAVNDTHSHASRPIETDRRNFTPHHINQLLKIKNYFRKRSHQKLSLSVAGHMAREASLHPIL